MNSVTIIIAFLILTLALTSCASTTMTLYSGEMELVTFSGRGCLEKDKTGRRIPLELALEQGCISNVQQISGYFKGPNIQKGHFFGKNLDRLKLVYPDEPSQTQGHTLVLLTTSEGVEGELQETPQSDSTFCYFEKAVLKLKQVATGTKAELAYDRQSKLFSADVYYNSGQSLLKAGKTEEAIHDLTKSLHLHNMVNPGDPDRALPAVSIAIAQIMSGREAESLAMIRKLFGEKLETEDAILKQRMTVSSSLCNDEQYLVSNAGQKATMQLMDFAAREFGSLNGAAVPLAACYYKRGKERKEQDDPDLAIEFFQKSIKLNPDNSGSIFEVVMTLVDKGSPAEGRIYLIEHAEIFIKRVGKEAYDNLLSFLYATEAQAVENRGDLVRAEELLREALKASPGERALIIKLTCVLAKEGKLAEARKILEDGNIGCSDESCRQEFADELARQDLIEWMMKRLETHSGLL